MFRKFNLLLWDWIKVRFATWGQLLKQANSDNILGSKTNKPEERATIVVSYRIPVLRLGVLFQESI